MQTLHNLTYVGNEMHCFKVPFFHANQMQRNDLEKQETCETFFNLSSAKKTLAVKCKILTTRRSIKYAVCEIC